MTESMVEKMRGAIFDVIWPAQEWNGEETTCRAVAEVAARAALQALREPTEEMKLFFAEADWNEWPTETAFVVVIDRALKENAE